MASELLYDPDVGRFINQDTYLGENGMPPSLHRYLYAYNNPNLYTDPDGHSVYAGAKSEPKTSKKRQHSFSDKTPSGRTHQDDVDTDAQRVNERHKNTQEAIDKYSCKDGANCPLISTGDADRDAAIKAAAEQSSTTGGSLTREYNNVGGNNELSDEINSSRERVTNSLRNMDRTLQATAGFHPAVGAFDTIQGAKKAIAFMRDNPGTSTTVVIAASCALIPKCRNAAKATGGKAWDSVKNASNRSKPPKGKNHNRDSALTDNETGFDPNYGKGSELSVRAGLGKTGEFSLSGAGKNNYVYAELDKKGVIDFAIEAGEGASIRGGEMFKSMMTYYGKNVKGVAGNWTYGTNLAKVNELTKGGMSLQGAISKTWTGNQAAKYGLSSARVTEVAGSPGSYTIIRAVFE